MSISQALHPMRAEPKRQHNAARISWIALEAGYPAANYANDVYTSVRELIEHEVADVVVVDGEADVTAEAIDSLRRHQSYANRLILTGRPGNDLTQALSDGPAPTDRSQLDRLWHEWSSRQDRLPCDTNNQDFLWAVDRWLLARPDAWIRPVRNPGNRSLYTYPLLNALVGNAASDALSLLEREWNLGHYDKGELIDRIRSCRECGSAHINYVDVCCHCGSLEIGRQPCLHCFICGHVDRQHKFSNGEGLRCPNCLTKLRHIGSDYDRPLENHQCESCQSLFIDAAVEARCLSCGHRHETDELRAREIRPFRLSEAGRLNRLLGNDCNPRTQSQQHKDPRLLTQEQFNDLVNWQISIHSSNKQTSPHVTLCPALLAVKLIYPDNSTQNRNTIDDHERLMDSLIGALTASERAVRQHNDLIWVLRPHCRSHDIETFHDYLEQQLKSMQQPDQTAKLRVKGYLLNRLDENSGDAELLQSQILSELSEDSV